MSVTASSKIERLSRQESKAKTCARLITAGRECFLRDGFKGATAEQISADAGFTRGAIQSNFEDKEGLFLAVVRENHQRRRDMFENLIRKFSGKELLMKLREGLADQLLEPDYLLWMEFELEALRNEKLRRGYAEFSKEIVRDGLNMLEGIRKSSRVRFAIDGIDLVVIMTSLVRGLAARQALLGESELSTLHAREMIYSVFGCNIVQAGVTSSEKRKP